MGSTHVGGRQVSRRVVLDIFILSGAAGLIYEVVWARQLVLVFGNTTQAVSTILTGFFGGMAIGSAVGGRIADRVRRPLRLYGMLEVLLVGVVLLTPVTFRLLHEVYRGAFGSLEATPVLLALVRFGLALLALAPATILMGATLPTLTRYLSRDAAHLSDNFGRLYAANTLGAIVGTILAGFVLIELIGLGGTLLVGAACSGIAGILAIVLDGRSRSATAAAGPAEMTLLADPPHRAVSGGLSAGQEPAIPADGSRLRLGLAVAFASGLTSLAYQTLWTRLLASGTGNSTYVFTAILALFLIGIALGATAFAQVRTRIRDTVGFLAVAQLVTAILVAIGAVAIIPSSSGGLLDFTASTGQSFGRFLVVAAVVVVPATFVMGLSFPAASALVAGPDGHVGRRAGLLLASNTVGAIVGTFVVPFLVIPLVGSPNALGLVAILNAGVAVALVAFGGIAGQRLRLAVGGGGAGIAVALAVLLAVGGVFVDPSVARIERTGGRVFASAEDEIASVQAGTARGGTPQLWVTGTSMTLLTVDAKLMPVLPLIARPASKTALVVAFGMGSAFRAALVAGLRTDTVELVPSVPTMFKFFYPDAAAVLADGNGRVLIADGRNHVELTDRRYDIIVTDPPPPIESSGVSVISSREYYAAGKSRLTPGGVMMQWIPYGQTVDEFRAHIRTFRDVYPNVLIAFGPGGYGFFMLGSDAPIAFEPSNIRAVLGRPGVAADISSAFDSPIKDPHDVAGWVKRISSLIWISGDAVAHFAGPGPLITDDRPLPEYFLLRHIFGPPSPRVSPTLLLQLTRSP